MKLNASLTLTASWTLKVRSDTTGRIVIKGGHNMSFINYPEETVTITRSEYDSLCDDARWRACVEGAGVDN